MTDNRQGCTSYTHTHTYTHTDTHTHMYIHTYINNYAVSFTQWQWNDNENNPDSFMVLVFTLREWPFNTSEGVGKICLVMWKKHFKLLFDSEKKSNSPRPGGACSISIFTYKIAYIWVSKKTFENWGLCQVFHNICCMYIYTTTW